MLWIDISTKDGAVEDIMAFNRLNRPRGIEADTVTLRFTAGQALEIIHRLHAIVDEGEKQS